MKKSGFAEIMKNIYSQTVGDILFADVSDQNASNASLGQLWKIDNYYEGESFLVFKFMEGKAFSSYNKNFLPYYHRLIQSNFEKFFFEVNNFKIVGALSEKEHVFTYPQLESIEIEPNKYIKAYNDAVIFMENDKKEKLVVSVDKREYDDAYRYVVHRSLNDVVDDSKNYLDEWLDYSRKNNFYKGKKIDANCNFLYLNDLSWEDVIIQDRVRDVIRANIDGLLSIRDIMKVNEISLKRGVILSGPPGTGKTMVCKILANVMDCSVIYVLPSHIRQLADIDRICDMAKDLSPTLLIFEDVDYLATDREDGGGWTVVELMNKIDGIEDFSDVITLATTNKIDKVEKAICNRPGRFDKVIKIGNPNKICREKMFRRFCKNMDITNIDIDEVVNLTKNMSGAYIFHLVSSATVEAAFSGDYDENKRIILKKEHVEKALECIKDKDFSTYYEVSNSDRGPIGFTPHAV